MALDASPLLGSPQVAGVQVSPLGTYKKTIGRVGRWTPNLMLGSLFWRVVLRKKLAAEQAEAAQSDAPDIDGRAYMAVTRDELALVAVDSRTRLRLREVISQVPLSDVVSADLSKGGTPGSSLPLRITLRDGRHWIFEAPWINRGDARKVVSALNG